jgi:hypothetical protein
MKSSLFQVFIDNTFMTYILLIQLSGLRFGLEKDFTLYNMIAHNIKTSNFCKEQFLVAQ